MLEKTNDNSKIAVIQTDISYIQRDIADIKEVLKTGYATKDALLVVAKETEARLTKLEQASNLTKWLFPILSGTFGSVLTFLLIQYIMNLR